MSSFSAILPTFVSNQPTIAVPGEEQRRISSSAAEVAAPRGVSAIASTDALVRAPQVAVPAKKVEPGFIYRAKQKFWESIVSFVFNSAKIQPIEVPVNEKLPMIRFSDKFPGMEMPNIYLTDGVPAAEESKAKQYLFAMIRWFSANVSLHADGLPPVAATHDAIIDEAFPAAYRELLPTPVVPAEISARPDDVLGSLALAGPFAGYIEKVGSKANEYVVDMSELEGVAVREGLSPLGCKAFFSYSPSQKRMNTTHIEYQGRVVTPQSEDWQHVQKIALCSLSTHMTMIRHLANTHLLVSGTFAGVTTNTLDADHPIRRLLHPHYHLTLSTNNYKVPNLMMSDSSAFPNIFSYERKDIYKIMNDHAGTFDIATMDPQADAQRRGMSGALGVDGQPLDYPYLENTAEMKSVIEDYVRSYVETYYDSDEALAADPQMQAWFAGLEKYVPNGVSSYAGGLTRDGVTKLSTVLIHTAAVEHENVGNITWNYTTLPQHIPSIVPADGSRPTVDVYQRYINTSVLTFVPLNRLVDDHANLALDSKGRACMEKFRDDLGELQKKMDAQPFSYAALYPEAMECSVST